jgi:hypothetical protein
MNKDEMDEKKNLHGQLFSLKPLLIDFHSVVSSGSLVLTLKFILEIKESFLQQLL